MKAVNLLLYLFGFIIIATLVMVVVKYQTPQSVSRNSNQPINQGNELFATPENPVVSPSKKFQLQVTQGNNGLVDFQRFDIAKVRENGLDPEVVFCSGETFRTSDRLLITWDSMDRVWVYSGDVGTYYWVRIDDTKWQKHSLGVSSSIHVPQELKKAIAEWK